MIELTANTLSSDVLPAFWRPIMVMSISVALSRISVSIINIVEACCSLSGSRYTTKRPAEAETTSDAGA